MSRKHKHRKQQFCDPKTAIEIADSSDLPDGAWAAMVEDLSGMEICDAIRSHSKHRPKHKRKYPPLPLYRCNDCGTTTGYWSKANLPMDACSCGSTNICLILPGQPPEPKIETLPDGNVILTAGLLESMRTLRGGWLGSVVDALGEDIQEKGWRQRLLGKAVTPETIEAAFAARDGWQ